jgi:hypothetical protein
MVKYNIIHISGHGLHLNQSSVQSSEDYVQKYGIERNCPFMLISIIYLPTLIPYLGRVFSRLVASFAPHFSRISSAYIRYTFLFYRYFISSPSLLISPHSLLFISFLYIFASFVPHFSRISLPLFYVHSIHLPLLSLFYFLSFASHFPSFAFPTFLLLRFLPSFTRSSLVYNIYTSCT